MSKTYARHLQSSVAPGIAGTGVIVENVTQKKPILSNGLRNIKKQLRQHSTPLADQHHRPVWLHRVERAATGVQRFAQIVQHALPGQALV